MKLLNLSLKEYVERYVDATQKMRVVKNMVTIFEGNIHDLFHQTDIDLYNNIVRIVGASDDFLCLSVTQGWCKLMLYEKLHNINKLLRDIRIDRNISQIEISGQTGLSK